MDQDSPHIPLRERKKQQTRLAISRAATTLFLDRGFDEVSVAEVAHAAGVSKMTVFNYFPRKEELLFDRVPEVTGLLAGAVAGRAPGSSPLDALRRLMHGLAEQGHPLTGFGENIAVFWRTVLDSAALRGFVREAAEELERGLAEQLAAEPGADPLRARFTASLGMAAIRTVFTTTARRILAGEPSAAVAADHAALVDRAFAAVEQARKAF
ncbi:TetR/AcrR family transcriptional regulator [Kitasatospora terrestris]|uniref:TetR/AcrR family transcriptional regulator n=1 Tax=Kitasatospora terrestris TaxID=258051 RepID=A0ABP9DT25_9ACTN